jgi:hypothetical protein
MMLSVAIADAVTLGCRVTGFVTNGPMWIFSVASATDVMRGYMSMKLYGESINPITLNPHFSASFAQRV